jgi:hypothetical protein
MHLFLITNHGQSDDSLYKSRLDVTEKDSMDVKTWIISKTPISNIQSPSGTMAKTKLVLNKLFFKAEPMHDFCSVVFVTIF